VWQSTAWQSIEATKKPASTEADAGIVAGAVLGQKHYAGLSRKKKRRGSTATGGVRCRKAGKTYAKTQTK
jgi:hypothetical protein